MRIGFVNNMPDAALESTERQFSNLLAGAAEGLEVELHHYSVPSMPRSRDGERLLHQRNYRDIDCVRDDDLDGLIVTGTEPKLADLSDEPYWAAFAELFDWIVQEGPPTIFSCLAAHAAVLHYDGIARTRLSRKCSGIFDHRVVGRHALTSSVDPFLRVSHSRWNEVRPSLLEQAGYQVLTYTPDAGVDLFVKDAGKLLVFFQGHPEYEPSCILREYKRDIRRYLTRQSDAFPTTPDGYFDSQQIGRLEAFAALAQTRRDSSLLDLFPCSAVNVLDERDGWTSPATGIIRNWLTQVSLRKIDRHGLALVAERELQDSP
jgi:homoserine O-succinyltransferase